MKEAKNNKILRSVLIFVGVILTGIIGFMMIEGWNLMDAAYMTIITLATVGYGETHELSSSGRMFTILLIIFGLGSAATILNSFAQMMLDNKLNHFLGRKAMNTEIKKINEHVILCGFGQIGLIIALSLKSKGIPFVIIEDDERELERAEQLGFLFVQGDITADVNLISAGIKRAKTLVVCVPDLTINLTLSLASKEINPKIEVIAQGVDRNLESRISRAGADTVVYPLALGGEQISELIAQKHVLDTSTIGKSIPIEGYYMKTYRHFQNDSISVSTILEQEMGLRAIALKLENGKIIDNPSLDEKVSNKDQLIILVNQNIYKIDSETGNFEKIEWSETYSVGIPQIDEEHMRLIHLINAFNEARFKGESKQILAKTFDNLIAYSLEHFRNEENLLKDYKYPKIEDHISAHRKLMETVLDLNKDKTYLFPNTISDFLRHWLIDHIMKCDKEYQQYLGK